MPNSSRIITDANIRFGMATANDAAAGLDGLLVTLITWIRRYVVVTDAQAVAIVLRVAHTQCDRRLRLHALPADPE